MSRSDSRAVSRSYGFTLVELLVVIAIIGILVALLLPAVQAAREAARRNQCTSQLKQFGLALQTHHDQLGAFPAGRTQTIQFGVSWAFRLLPFLEESAIHDAYVERQRVDDDANATAMRSPVPVAFCPSRRTPAADRDFDNNDQPSLLQEAAAGGDYAANAGTRLRVGIFDDPETAEAMPARRIDLSEAGPIFTYSSVRARRVTDGLSKTLGVGEKHVVPTPFEKPPGPVQTDHYWQGDTAYFAGDQPEASIRVGGRRLRSDNGSPESVGDVGAARESFGSAHPGVTQFVYLDGHVEPISNDTQVETLEKLAAIGDGEVIGEETP